MSTTNRYMMNDAERAERARVKVIHGKLRAPLRGGRSGDRYDLLAWAYARGMKFRRCEGSHHTQVVNGQRYEHNMPAAWHVWERLVKAGFLAHDADPGKSSHGVSWHLAWCRVEKEEAGRAITVWIADPNGAAEAPPPRARRPYIRAEAPVAVAAE